MRPELDDDEDDVTISRYHIALLKGDSFALWAPPDVESKVIRDTGALVNTPHSVGELELYLAPGRFVVIGRANGYRVPYLHPSYQATTVVPGSGQSVLRTEGTGDDTFVSRAHFTLRGAAGGGLVLTNGVPGLDGAVRPPTNWTYLVEPDARLLAPAEEVLILYGVAIAIQLPNRSVVRLTAR